MSPHKRVADVFWAQTTVPAAFLKPQCKYNENSRISNPLHRATEALPSDHPSERGICAVMTCGKANIKKNLVEFYRCLPNDEYTKLKWYAPELVSVCKSTYEYADTVRDDICNLPWRSAPRLNICHWLWWYGTLPVSSNYKTCYPTLPRKKIPFLLDLYYNIYTYSTIIWNSVNKNFIDISVLSCYVSTYIISFILPLSLQNLKYLPSAPSQRSLPIRFSHLPQIFWPQVQLRHIPHIFNFSAVFFFLT